MNDKIIPDPSETAGVTQEDVASAFSAATPFPVVQHSHEGHAHFVERLIDVYHTANQLDARHQAVGLLNTISQSCGMIAAIMTGQMKSAKFTVNPMFGLFYQFEVLRRLFPVDEADIALQRDNMVAMYFLTQANVDKAVPSYLEQGITVDVIYATELDGEARYVLRLIEHKVADGQKSSLNPGQLMWYFDKDSAQADLTESDWNPYFIAPPTEAANDAALPEGFGDAEFVGHGSDPVIVAATFDPPSDGDNEIEGSGDPQNHNLND